MTTQPAGHFVLAIIALTSVIAAEIIFTANLPRLYSEGQRILMASAVPEMIMTAGSIGEDPYLVVPP
jgi:hypothetical protein